MAATGDEANRAGWNAALGEHVLLYPHERVVALLQRHFGDRGANAGRNGLDVGMGSGRHVALLLDYGFRASGLDYAPRAVEIARATLGGHPGLGDLLACDVREAGFAPGAFDVVIAWGVASTHPPRESTAQLGLIREWAAPGGRLLLNFRTRENWFAELGEPGDGAMRLDERAGPYAGLTYSFFDMDEAVAVVEDAGWRVDDVEREDHWRDRVSRQHSWWIVDAARAD